VELTDDKVQLDVSRAVATGQFVLDGVLFVGRPRMAALLDCSEATLDRLEACGTIPPRRRLSKGRSGWLAAEVLDALRKLPLGPNRERTAAAREALKDRAEARARRR
jgi:predicted DNA-binding transcriptional regulator AlpA